MIAENLSSVADLFKTGSPTLIGVDIFRSITFAASDLDRRTPMFPPPVFIRAITRFRVSGRPVLRTYPLSM